MYEWFRLPGLFFLHGAYGSHDRVPGTEMKPQYSLLGCISYKARPAERIGCDEYTQVQMLVACRFRFPGAARFA
ncbi:MAG TPA: hypothetical protein PKE63_03750 [Lacibacter sp.]|nr:hypothetical protein [Lacibacter sp.]HMP86364.1 hypothetical protein [Lacibacter sp.]